MSGVVGYNVQTAVDTKHHLIVTHEVTNVGTDRSQLASVAKQNERYTPDGNRLIPMPARWRQVAGAQASSAITCRQPSTPSII